MVIIRFYKSNGVFRVASIKILNVVTLYTSFNTIK